MMDMSKFPSPTPKVRIKRGEGFQFKWNTLAEQYFASIRVFLRYPWRIRGGFRIGQTVAIPWEVRAEPYSTMPPGKFASIGAFSYVRSTQVPADFQCGRYCSIAPNVEVTEHEHPLDRFTTHVCTYRQRYQQIIKADFGQAPTLHPFEALVAAPRIGHDVWIGSGTLLKRGITIGHGAVVGARSIVTRDVPPYAIVVGAPAKVIRYRFDDSIIERLLALEWWRFHQAQFSDLDPTDIESFISTVSSRANAGALKPVATAIDIAVGLREFLSNPTADATSSEALERDSLLEE